MKTGLESSILIEETVDTEIRNYKPDVVIIGLGYIGLPTAALLSQSNTKVLGVDINPEVVSTINSGKIHIVEPELDTIVEAAVKNGFLKATEKPLEANTYLIVVPTPFKEKNEPDISYVIAATTAIIPTHFSLTPLRMHLEMTSTSSLEDTCSG